MQSVEQAVATGEMRIARRHAMEGPGGRDLALTPMGHAFHRGKDAALALAAAFLDADEIGVLKGGQQPVEPAVLDPQEDEAAASAGQARRQKSGPLGAGERGLVVVGGQQGDEVPTALERIVHRGDEVRPADEIVVLDAHRVSRLEQHVGDLLGHLRRSHRAG